MRILFIQTNCYAFLHPLPVGPALVARRLEADGHTVTFVDMMGERDPVAAARAAARGAAPALCCFSVRNRDNQSATGYLDPMPLIGAMAQAVRGETRAPFLVGGTAFTTYPARVLGALGAEYGIAGDDLEPISRFVRSLEAGAPDLGTPGLVYRDGDGAVRENAFVLAGYAGVRFDHEQFVERARYRRGLWQAAVVTRSGCPEPCVFCDTFHTFGRAFRLRDPEEVAGEMLELKRGRRVRSVWLADAGFNRPLEHAKAVLEAIIRRGAQLALYAIHDPGPADPEYFRLFRRAGGLMVNVFAESLADPVLEAARKSFRAAEIYRDAEWMRAAGLGFLFMPTFGGPGETRATVEETLSGVSRLRPTLFEAGIGWRIQPRTELRERAVAEGLLGEADDCWDATFYISPATPRVWIEERIGAWKRGRPLYWWPMVPFAARAALWRPWRWGPGAPG